MSDKQALRSIFIERRRSLLGFEVAKASSVLSKHLEEVIERIPSVKRIVGYFPIHNEIDPIPFFETNKLVFQPTIYFPRFDGKEYRFSTAKDLCASLEKGPFGVPQPLESSPSISLAEAQKTVDIWLVPGLAFDHQGYRLGMGKGFYDRFLKDCQGLRFGLGYDWQVADKLPKDTWDIAMDIIITDQHIWVTSDDNQSKLGLSNTESSITE
jgi:5-formyltetrahydrofolate cyclo-ligase